MGQEVRLISRYPGAAPCRHVYHSRKSQGPEGLSRRILTVFQSETSGPRQGYRAVDVGLPVKMEIKFDKVVM